MAKSKSFNEFQDENQVVKLIVDFATDDSFLALPRPKKPKNKGNYKKRIPKSK